ncbi:MAG: 2-succinyl-6-hydroxy-2,4-cyclohexadiene-1-carboxylate synthase [Chloroflexota bacterium]
MKLNVNGLDFNVEVRGKGPALVLLHGFSGSGESWLAHSDVYSQHRRTIALDVIGHGQSACPSDSDRYTVEGAVSDIEALLQLLEASDADVLGYSMGGRVALAFAARAPSRVRTLILESASPGLLDGAERRARARRDDELAEVIEKDGLVGFIDRWEKMPLFASQAGLPEVVLSRQRQIRLRNRSVGLANSLRGMSVGRQPSFWDVLPDLRMPVLLIAGELDMKFREMAVAMDKLLSNGKVVVIENAGHTTHLEQPRVFDRAVLDFLRSHEPATAGKPNQGARD